MHAHTHMKRILADCTVRPIYLEKKTYGPIRTHSRHIFRRQASPCQLGSKRLKLKIWLTTVRSIRDMIFLMYFFINSIKMGTVSYIITKVPLFCLFNKYRVWLVGCQILGMTTFWISKSCQFFLPVYYQERPISYIYLTKMVGSFFCLFYSILATWHVALQVEEFSLYAH